MIEIWIPHFHNGHRFHIEIYWTIRLRVTFPNIKWNNQVNARNGWLDTNYFIDFNMARSFEAVKLMLLVDCTAPHSKPKLYIDVNETRLRSGRTRREDFSIPKVRLSQRHCIFAWSMAWHMQNVIPVLVKDE